MDNKKQFFKLLYLTLIYLSILALSACNKPPVADAGDDKAYFERSRVTLRAKASDPNEKDKLSFIWRQLNGEMVQNMEGETTENLSFTLPSVASDEIITLKFTATDSQGESVSDTVDVSIMAYASLAKLSMADPAFDRCTKNKLYHLAWDDMGNAENLNCAATETQSLRGLENLPNLKQLIISQNNISDLASLQTLRKMEQLNISNNNVTHLFNLQMLRNLRILSASGNPITSIKGLEKLNQLREVYLGKTNFKDDQLKYLVGLGNLKILYLNDNNIEYIRYLGHIPSLKEVYLHNNNIKDPTPLLALSKITRIYLEGNNNMNCSAGNKLKKKFGDKVTLPKHCL